jgi:iron complex outermembrane recepter protein
VRRLVHDPRGPLPGLRPDWNFVGDYVLDRATGNTLRPRAGDVYNYGPLNYMQRPDERYSAGGFANYEFNEHFEAYGEVMFMDNNSDAQIAESGNFGNTDQLNCDNPMLSEQQRNLLCTQAGFGPGDYTNTIILRRSVETGPRTSIMRHTSWRMVGGLKGDINDAWSYDAYGLYAEVSSPQEYVGDLSVNNMIDALDVIGDPNDPSTWRCRSGNPGCAPWNIFRAGGVTQEAMDYIMLNMVLSSGTKTQLVNGTLFGDLEEYGLIFPSASEGIQVAVGAEYRKEWLYVHPDDNWESGNGSGQGGPTVRVDGEYSVQRASSRPWCRSSRTPPASATSQLELGYRYSDYSTAGGHPPTRPWRPGRRTRPSSSASASTARPARPTCVSSSRPRASASAAATTPAPGPTPCSASSSASAPA